MPKGGKTRTASIHGHRARRSAPRSSNLLLEETCAQRSPGIVDRETRSARSAHEAVRRHEGSERATRARRADGAHGAGRTDASGEGREGDPAAEGDRPELRPDGSLEGRPPKVERHRRGDGLRDEPPRQLVAAPRREGSGRAPPPESAWPEPRVALAQGGLVLPRSADGHDARGPDGDPEISAAPPEPHAFERIRVGRRTCSGARGGPGRRARGRVPARGRKLFSLPCIVGAGAEAIGDRDSRGHASGSGHGLGASSWVEGTERRRRRANSGGPAIPWSAATPEGVTSTSVPVCLAPRSFLRSR